MVFYDTRSYAALQAAYLDRFHRVGIQLGQVHFGVFSTSRFVPPALNSDWRGVKTDLGAGISKNVTDRHGVTTDLLYV